MYRHSRSHSMELAPLDVCTSTGYGQDLQQQGPHMAGVQCI